MTPATAFRTDRLTTWWADTYPRLAHDLGFDTDQDEEAAHHLKRLIEQHDLQAIPLRRIRLAKRVVVAGAADCLQSDLEKRPLTPDESLVVADGAIHQILKQKVPPSLIVSDLDADPARLVRLNATGTPVAIHAHGDNIHLLDQWVPRFPGPVIATRQTPGEQPAQVHCPGGFADGDRAVLLSAHLGAKQIRLVGFDLYGPPGKTSPTDPERKRRKMRWSARILDEARRLGVPLEP